MVREERHHLAVLTGIQRLKICPLKGYSQINEESSTVTISLDLPANFPQNSSTSFAVAIAVAIAEVIAEVIAVSIPVAIAVAIPSVAIAVAIAVAISVAIPVAIAGVFALLWLYSCGGYCCGYCCGGYCCGNCCVTVEKIALSHLFGKSVAEGGSSTLLGARRSLCEDDTNKMQARECDTRKWYEKKGIVWQF